MAAVTSWWALDGSCLFLMGFGWLLFILDGLYGCCCFLIGCEWLLFIPMGSGWLLFFPNGLWMVSENSRWAVDGSC